MKCLTSKRAFLLIIITVVFLFGCSDPQSESVGNSVTAGIDVLNTNNLNVSEVDEELEEVEDNAEAFLTDDTSSLSFSSSKNSKYGASFSLQKKKKNHSTDDIIVGKWVSGCRYMGGNEYLFEVIYVPEKHNKVLYKYYYNSNNNECEDPWIQVSQSLQYSLHNPSKVLSASGAQINFSLIATQITPHSEAVTEALNGSCSRYFKPQKRKTVNGLKCGEYFQFPRSGERYYDIIRIEDDTLRFGNQIDQTDESLRPTQFANYAFTLQ